MRVLALVFAAAACAPAEPVAPTATELAVYPTPPACPPTSRTICRLVGRRHWLGEFGYDVARRRQIETAVRQSCHGIDARGAHHERHAGVRVLARIADYEALEE